MKAKWYLGGILAASTLAAPAFGQISIMIGTPPPPIRYEVAPPMPQPGYVWMPGYWAPVHGRYAWYSGRWANPPYHGAAWNSPRWRHEGDGWRYYDGGWERHGHHGHGHAYGHYK